MNKSIKIARSTTIINKMYAYYRPQTLSLPELINKIEIYGYELDSETILRGTFDISESIPSILLIATNIIQNNKPIIIPTLQIVNISDKDLITSALLEIYLLAIEDNCLDEIIKSKSIIVNDYVLSLISDSLDAVVSTDDFISEIIKDMDEINFNINNHIYKQTINLSDKYYQIRDYLLTMGYKEIMTHPIIDNSSGDKAQILNNPFLSHNYVRKQISESYIFEYAKYKIYSYCFEISHTYNLSNLTDQPSLFIAINKLVYSDEFLISLLYSARIANRCVVNNNIITYVDTNNKSIAIGIITKQQKHILIDINLDLVKFDLPSEYATANIYNINVLNLNPEDIINIYSANNKIYNINIIDIYNNKFTIRITTLLTYEIVSTVLKNKIGERLII